MKALVERFKDAICKHRWFQQGRYRECGKCGKAQFID